jgi:hypothetical protein
MGLAFFELWLSIAMITVLIVCIRGWKQIKKKWLVIPIFIVFFVGCSIFQTFPVENLFITFQTPEKAFRYEHMTGRIQGIMQGKASCFILYTDMNGAYSHMICHKNEKGYKLAARGFSNQSYRSEVGAIPTIEVYNARNTKDFYIVCWFHSEELSISDNRNTEFLQLYDNNAPANINMITYGYVENMDSDYYLIVDGEKIYLMDL